MCTVRVPDAELHYFLVHTPCERSATDECYVDDVMTNNYCSCQRYISSVHLKFEVTEEPGEDDEEKNLKRSQT